MALTQAANIAWFGEHQLGGQKHFHQTAIITVLIYSALFSICQTTSLPQRLFSRFKEEHVSTVCSYNPCCLLYAGVFTSAGCSCSIVPCLMPPQQLCLRLPACLADNLPALACVHVASGRTPTRCLQVTDWNQRLLETVNAVVVVAGKT